MQSLKSRMKSTDIDDDNNQNVFSSVALKMILLTDLINAWRCFHSVHN